MPPTKERVPHWDALRGLAVVFMLLWHTADSWAAPSWRQNQHLAFELARFFGGSGAPLFLFLVGVSLSLAGRATEHAPPLGRFYAALGKGLEIWILGYLLRLQMWSIDTAGVRLPGAWRMLLAILLGWLLCFRAARLLAANPKRALLFLVAGFLCLGVGYYDVHMHHPTAIFSLLRVDVLQAIGLSMMLVAVLEANTNVLRRGLFAPLLFALLVFVITPIVVRHLPGPLPDFVASYFGKWPVPPGQKSPTLFPLLPWLAYVFFGMAIETAWYRASQQKKCTTFALMLASGGALFCVVTSEVLPFNQHLLGLAPDLIPAWRVTYRTGGILVYLALIYGLLQLAEPVFAPFQTLGKASLWVYWIHLAFAFGIFAKPFSRRLSPLEWALGCLVLTCAMWGIAWLRGQMKQAKSVRIGRIRLSVV